MDNDLVRNNYRVLQSNIQIIKNNLIELEDLYEDLILNTKENFTVNDKIVCCDLFDEIKDEFNLVKNETINELIPNINNRI